ncbi:MAG: hypothetical protein HPY65_17405 [Syntrophaceae bacterium]|nr:hypothetical protein [Syntrophaceae bacterium]
MSKGAVRDLLTLSSLIHDEALFGDLKRSYPDETCYFWGIQERKGDNLATWNSMAAGDLVLGYHERSIVSASYVLVKTNNPTLAKELWGRDSEEPFGLICFTDKPHVGDVPIVPQMSRYIDPEYHGFVMLPPEKVGNMVGDYGSIETFVQLCLGYDFPFSLRHT